MIRTTSSVSCMCSASTTNDQMKILRYCFSCVLSTRINIVVNWEKISLTDVGVLYMQYSTFKKKLSTDGSCLFSHAPSPIFPEGRGGKAVHRPITTV